MALSGAATARAEGVRDDTAVLQAALDHGGSVVIPKLPGGECYRTRGLWVTHDDTMVTSDGACLVLTGRGEARLKTGTGRPIYATDACFLNRGRLFDPLPARIRISGVRIAVPAPRKGEGVRLDGIDVEAHEVTIDHVSIGGTPTTDVLVGGGTPGFGGLSERITITDNVLT